MGEAQASPLTGVWGAVDRRIDGGDERIEKHELHIERRGDSMTGFWTRSLSWHSLDGRPFACNGKPRYEVRWRSIVAGPVGGDIADLRTMAARQETLEAGCPPNPPPQACRLHRTGSDLVAICGKRWVKLSQRLGAPVPLALALGVPGKVTGVWTWHNKSNDAQGDVKIEDEVWNLLQRNEEIVGYYDRQVIVRSGDGRRFVCNNELAYANVTRYRVAGKIVDGQLVIRELDYRAQPGLCETGKRRLDSYRGVVSTSSDSIRLAWSKGAQLLIRRH